MRRITIEKIKRAVEYARGKHPFFAKDYESGYVVLGEEVGEVSEAIQRKNVADIKTETLHVMAVCVRILEEL